MVNLQKSLIAIKTLKSRRQPPYIPFITLQVVLNPVVQPDFSFLAEIEQVGYVELNRNVYILKH